MSPRSLLGIKRERRPTHPRGELRVYFLLHSKKKDHTQVAHTTGVALAERAPTQDSDRQPLPPSTQSSSHKPEVLQSTWEQPGSATTKAILVSTCSVSSFGYTKMAVAEINNQFCKYLEFLRGQTEGAPLEIMFQGSLSSMAASGHSSSQVHCPNQHTKCLSPP